MTELKPCPFCGGEIEHKDTWARSFQPPRLYHEYRHPRNGCVALDGKFWVFTDDPAPREKFIADWNRRTASDSELAAPAPTGIHGLISWLEMYRTNAGELSPTLQAAAKTIKHIRRIAGDRLYMMHAYRNMLGEKGLEVARNWDERGVERVHYEWSGGAAHLSGEQRAEEILRWESAPRREVENIDDGLPEPIDVAEWLKPGRRQDG